MHSVVLVERLPIFSLVEIRIHIFFSLCNAMEIVFG